jgi:di/tricarboxylate transporter
LVLVLHRAGPPETAATPPPSTPLSREEKTLATILLAALALWVTDAWHGLPPAWVGLAAAVVCLLPPLRLVPADAFAGRVKFAPFFFVAGVLGLGAVAAHTGLGDRVAGAATALLPLHAGAQALNFGLMSALNMVVGLLTTLPGVPAVMTPLAPRIAEASKFTLEAVLMTQVVGFSTLLLPYQAPPIVLGMQLSGVSMRHAMRLALILAALSIIVLWPLDYLWWRLLGLI